MHPLCKRVCCRQVTLTIIICTNAFNAVQTQELCSRVVCPSLSSLQRSLLQGCLWQPLFFGVAQHRHTFFYVSSTAILSVPVTHQCTDASGSGYTLAEELACICSAQGYMHIACYLARTISWNACKLLLLLLLLLYCL